MNKNLKTLGAIVPVMLIVGVFGYALTSGSDSVEDPENAAINKDTTLPPTDAVDTRAEDSTEAAGVEQVEGEEESTAAPQDIADGSYVNYSAENFASAADSKRVLFFHSLTCIVCEQIDRTISAGAIPDGISLFRVQMEQESELLSKYSINAQTTFVQVDQNGDEVKKWNWLSKPFADADDIAAEVI